MLRELTKKQIDENFPSLTGRTIGPAYVIDASHRIPSVDILKVNDQHDVFSITEPGNYRIATPNEAIAEWVREAELFASLDPVDVVKQMEFHIASQHIHKNHKKNTIYSYITDAPKIMMVALYP